MLFRSGMTGELKTQGQSLVQEIRTQGEIVTTGIRDQGQAMAMEVVMQGQIVTKNLQEQAESITKGMREHSNAVTQELRDQGTAVFDLLREESGSMTGQIREHSEAMLVTATNAAERLRDIVENSSTKAVGQLSQVVEALAQTGEPLLNRVSELTESLGDVVVRTDNSLVQLEGMLQTRMHNIEQTLGLIYRESNHAAERVSQHVDVLRQATGTISEQMRNVNETTGTLARLESQFSAAISAREASPAHALLIHGAEGIGKLALGRAWAQRILCEATPGAFACGQCDGCHWFLGGQHPDYRQIQPEALAGVEVDAELPVSASKTAKPSLEIKVDRSEEHTSEFQSH